MTAQDKKIAGHTLKGKTSAKFNGITTPTLRAWLTYWTSDKVKANDPALQGELKTKEAHADAIRKEIVARGKTA